MSDHKYICYQIDEAELKPKLYRSYGKVDWKSFQDRSAAIIAELPDITPLALDDCADALESQLKQLIDAVAPLKELKCHLNARWWTPKLDEQRLLVRKLRTRLRRHPSSEEYFRQYEEALTTYRKMLRQAKRDDWKLFCSELKDPKSIAQLIKGMRDVRLPANALLNRQGAPSTTPLDSTQLLFDTHLPGHSTEIWEDKEARLPKDGVCEITPQKVATAFKSFRPYKAAGPDGIQPVVLRNLSPQILQYITEMYQCSIATGYTPKAWRQMKLVFIPKPGKDDYAVPKSFRPITLSNFLLKGLERIVQWELNATVLAPLYNQHAYTPGLSTETALSEAVDFIEKNTLRGQHVIAVSLDCGGAFDATKFLSARKALENYGIPQYITDWYDRVLKYRTVASATEGTSYTARPTQGTPQGGVLSPTIWNLVLHELLQQFQRGPVLALGYADDVLLLVAGIDPTATTSIMTQTLKEVTQWGDRHGLTFNPQKTQLIAFTKAPRRTTFPIVRLKGVDLPYSRTITYLGLTLHRNLSWTTHIQAKIKKAKRTFQLAKAVIRKTWGLRTPQLWWLYQSLIRPLLSYGSVVFAHRITKGDAKRMEQLQRQFLLSMTHAMRSTPTAGLEVALGVMPLDLFLQQVATTSYLRIRPLLKHTWDGLADGAKVPHRRHHLSLLQKEGLDCLNFERPVKKFLWDLSTDPLTECDYTIYTDGSKTSAGTGCAWTLTEGNTALQQEIIPLHPDASVYQAEVTAIKQSLENLLAAGEALQGKQFLICSDSQSAISALYNPIHCTELTYQTAALMKQIQQDAGLQLKWVRGHADDTGNELADALAKAASERTADTTNPVALPYTHAKQCIKQIYISQWQSRWETMETCKHTRAMLPKVTTDNLRLICKSHIELDWYVQIVTGHSLFRKHMSHWRDIPTECRFCGDEDETPFHLYHDCPTFEQHRRHIASLDQDPQAVATYGERSWIDSLMYFFLELRLVTILKG